MSAILLTNVRVFDGRRLNTVTPCTRCATLNVTPVAGWPASILTRSNAHTCAFLNDCAPVVANTFADM